MKGGSAYKMQIRLSFLHQLHVHTNVFCLLLHILLCDMGVDVHCSREIGMNNRTMATVYVDRDSISLKTRSRSGCSPQYFIILKKELQRLEEKKYLITKDIHSYAELRLCDAVGGAKVLEFSFTWLKDAGRDSVSGYTERIRLPYEPFRSYAAGEGETVDRTRWRLLSIPEQNRPTLEFHSRKNLKAVVENPILRHKLGKFLDQHFNWYNYERIVLTDDYLPYSFFFEGYMVQGTKTCGGVILHKAA